MAQIPSPASVDLAVFAEVRGLVAAARRPVVLSGAGMSAESGIPTFREAQTGLWRRFSAEQLATQEAFLADPDLVWSWYRWRARTVRACRPNPGHGAVARWQQRLVAAGDDGPSPSGAPAPGLVVVTQNVDDLHERAGAQVASHLHGSLFEYRCMLCASPAEVDLGEPDEGVEAGSEEDLEAMRRHTPPRCEVCGEGRLRPGIVWFGEMLPADAWDRAYAALEQCDLCVVVGTSGVVQPAASLPLVARGAGAPVVEVNPDETELSDTATHVLRGRAGEVLPALVA